MYFLSRRSRDAKLSRKRKNHFRQAHRQKTQPRSGEKRFYKKCVDLHSPTTLGDKILEWDSSESTSRESSVEGIRVKNNNESLRDGTTKFNLQRENKKESLGDSEMNKNNTVRKLLFIDTNEVNKTGDLTPSKDAVLQRRESTEISEQTGESDRQLRTILQGLNMEKNSDSNLSDNQTTDDEIDLIDEAMERNRTMHNDENPNSGEQMSNTFESEEGCENLPPSPLRYEMADSDKDAKVFLSLKRERRRTRRGSVSSITMRRPMNKRQPNVRAPGRASRGMTTEDQRALSHLEVNVNSDSSVSSCSMDSAFLDSHRARRIPFPPPPPPPRKNNNSNTNRNNNSSRAYEGDYTPIHLHHNNISLSTASEATRSNLEFHCDTHEKTLGDMAKATIGYMDEMINRLLGNCAHDDMEY